MEVKLTPVRKDKPFTVPYYATPGSAGADIYSGETRILKRGEIYLFETNISIEIPEGYEVQIRPRSGLAIKHGITVINSPGTIDSDYRGEVKVGLINLGTHHYEVREGDRIAQMVLNKVERADFPVVYELSDTSRGSGGYGHTGI